MYRTINLSCLFKTTARQVHSEVNKPDIVNLRSNVICILDGTNNELTKIDKAFCTHNLSVPWAVGMQHEQGTVSCTPAHSFIKGVIFSLKLNAKCHFR